MSIALHYLFFFLHVIMAGIMCMMNNNTEWEASKAAQVEEELKMQNGVCTILTV